MPETTGFNLPVAGGIKFPPWALYVGGGGLLLMLFLFRGSDDNAGAVPAGIEAEETRSRILDLEDELRELQGLHPPIEPIVVGADDPTNPPSGGDL